MNIVVVWFLVQVFDRMYYFGTIDPIVILEGVEKEVEWIRRVCSYKYWDSLEALRMEIRMQILSFNYDL